MATPDTPASFLKWTAGFCPELVPKIIVTSAVFLLATAALAAGLFTQERAKTAALALQTGSFPSYTNFSNGPAGAVFSGGGPNAWDEVLREKVWVLQENGIYKMWYVGHTLGHEATSKVGYATSLDGISWTRYAGNPIIDRISQDQDITVVKAPDGTYYMYVEVNDVQIDLFTSLDGISWTPYANNPVLAGAASPVAWRENNTWYMLYENMVQVFDIRLATSPDGKTWTNSPANPVLKESDITIPDSVVKDGDTYHLYYHFGANSPAYHAVSKDLTTWTSRQRLSNMSSPYVFKNLGGLWAYFWNIAGDSNYYLRYGQDSNPSAAQPDLQRYYNFDSGSGTVAADSSSFQANARLINGPLWTAGVFGGGLSFNGIDQYVDTGFTTYLDTWTVACWVKSPGAPNSNKASGPVNYDKNFQLNWNHPSVLFRGAAAVYIAGAYYPASFGSLLPNTWYHLAATYDGTALNAYRNGVLVSSVATPRGYLPTPESNTLKLGRHAAAGQYFAGTLDDVKIYGRALSSIEVSQLSQSDPTPPSTPTLPLAQPAGEQVSLSWQASSDPESGVSQYKIYRATNSGNETLLTPVAGGALSYVDRAVLPGTAYFYQVTAINGAGLESSRSPEVSAITGNNPPAAPVGLTAQAGDQQVKLTWNANTEIDLASYKIYQAIDTGPLQFVSTTPAMVNNSTVSGLVNGAPYRFAVSALDNAGYESTLSDQVSVAPTNDAGGSLADDFNDNLRDVTKWNLGTLTSPTSDAAVTVLEQNQRLEIKPRTNFSDNHFNGYVSAATRNLTGSRAFVEIISTATGGANTIFAVGTDSNNYYRFVVADSQLYFQEKLGGVVTSASIAYNSVYHRFWQLRHDAATDSIVFETSVDGLKWNDRRAVPRRLSMTAVWVELGGGSSQNVSTPGLAIFDNFNLVSNNATPTPTPSQSPTPTPTPTATPTPTTTPTPSPTPPLTGSASDDFNDNSQDPTKWSLGVLSSPVFDSLVAALEQNQRLEIQPLANVAGNHYNGFVSAGTLNLNNSRIAVEVVAAPATGADTIFAIGTDNNNYYRFVVSGSLLYLQEKVAGVVTQTSIAFDPVNHRFWRIRHDLLTNMVIFETSPNGVTNWNDRRSGVRRVPLTAARIELGSGSSRSVAAPARSIFDNLAVNSP